MPVKERAAIHLIHIIALQDPANSAFPQMLLNYKMANRKIDN